MGDGDVIDGCREVGEVGGGGGCMCGGFSGVVIVE